MGLTYAIALVTMAMESIPDWCIKSHCSREMKNNRHILNQQLQVAIADPQSWLAHVTRDRDNLLEYIWVFITKALIQLDRGRGGVNMVTVVHIDLCQLHMYVVVQLVLLTSAKLPGMLIMSCVCSRAGMINRLVN